MRLGACVQQQGGAWHKPQRVDDGLSLYCCVLNKALVCGEAQRGTPDHHFFEGIGSCTCRWLASVVDGLHLLSIAACVLGGVQVRTHVTTRLVQGVEALGRMLHPEVALPRCPDKAVHKLALSGGQRCRPRLLPNYFLPFV